MAFMISKLYTMHMVQVYIKLPVVFAEIRLLKPEKMKPNLCRFWVRHSVSAYM